MAAEFDGRLQAGQPQLGYFDGEDEEKYLGFVGLQRGAKTGGHAGGGLKQLRGQAQSVRDGQSGVESCLQHTANRIASLVILASQSRSLLRQLFQPRHDLFQTLAKLGPSRFSRQAPRTAIDIRFDDRYRRPAIRTIQRHRLDAFHGGVI
ncbi:MAG: hypothetical protein U0935_02630 [Pirellulales bacterium]